MNNSIYLFVGLFVASFAFALSRNKKEVGNLRSVEDVQLEVSQIEELMIQVSSKYDQKALLEKALSLEVGDYEGFYQIIQISGYEEDDETFRLLYRMKSDQIIPKVEDKLKTKDFSEKEGFFYIMALLSVVLWPVKFELKALKSTSK